MTHSLNVAELSLNLSSCLNFSKNILTDIYTSALLHDIGKTDLNQKTLNKKENLTEKEFEHIKQHSIYGYQRIIKMGLPTKIALNILHHHENYDGTGYPKKLQGSQIPLEARIIRIADTYDALISTRPYRKKLSHKEAIQIMKKGQRFFDPNIFYLFLKYME